MQSVLLMALHNQTRISTKCQKMRQYFLFTKVFLSTLWIVRTKVFWLRVILTFKEAFEPSLYLTKAIVFFDSMAPPISQLHSIIWIFM